MGQVLWLVLGGALGGMARYGFSGWIGQRTAGFFPWGTLVVNASGALAIGLLAGAAGAGADWITTPAIWQPLAVGFLGCYTTVSAFSLQTLLLLRGGRAASALGNVALSLLLCPAAALLGMLAGARLAGAA